MNNIPHLAMPLRVVGGAYASNQQGTNDEVAACVAVICSFPRGSREEAPEFGIDDPSFQQRPIDATDIQQACEDFEPRAIIRVEEQPYNPADPTADAVTIAVSVLQTEDI